MDSLVALSDNSFDALEVGSLGGPIAGGARAVLFASQNNELLARIDVLLSSVEDSHFLARGDVDGGGTDLRHHLVDEANVGKGSTSHDLVVTSAGSVGVVVLSSDAALLKVSSSGGVLGDLTSWGDVISRDRVTNVEQAVSTNNVRDSRRDDLGRLEEGRVVNVG